MTSKNGVAERDDSPPEPAPRTRRALRKSGWLLVACVASVALTLVVATVLIIVNGNPDGALHALRKVQPWLICAQVAALCLAWHRWPALIARLARARQMSPAAQDAVVRARSRIFVLLGACELLIVMRAVMS
jgi:hypothetical protein